MTTLLIILAVLFLPVTLAILIGAVVVSLYLLMIPLSLLFGLVSWQSPYKIFNELTDIKAPTKDTNE